ncbi:uncharacterized protein LOC125708743 isoform X2 [Brienomyrus brachyistius]|uniref:uncharacterized protein LOC125708743 isoform X2 n=1 Tax=Brienomyrus brachyistius TaxID=42636 RepID=UPI0020B2F5E2|nr:uncharacterized protein LOC125708743 isoform X2 [Brienomyrus brachyistius]
MGWLRALTLFFITAFLPQVSRTAANLDCPVTAIKSTSASSLTVKWNKYIGATNYFLDLRVVNVTDVAPVVVTLPASSTERLVYGLRPATTYNVTVKVFQFYHVRCVGTSIATTVPATTWITLLKAISSTAIRLEWAPIQGAQHYLVIVASATERHNRSVEELSAVIGELRPATSYSCYVYACNAAGQGASSQGRTIVTLLGPPEVTGGEHVEESTARIRWKGVDKVLLYHVMITDTSDSRAAPVTANVSATYVDIKNIKMCSAYDLAISSYDAFLQAGDATHFTYKTSTLSPADHISVEYSCVSRSVIVTWHSVYGADSYKALAIDSRHTVLSCTSLSPSCQITGTLCSQRYTVYVIAMSKTCESTTNSSSYFETVPCPPANVEVFRECFSNVIIFSWGATSNSLYYRATAVDSEGERTDCLTRDTSCYFTNTKCGRRYRFTVFAMSGECNSSTSLPAHIRTAPCQPRNVKTRSECHSDVLISQWDAAAGAKMYMVEMMGNSHNLYNCSSITNSCATPGVQCGESLTVWITTSDDECSSEKALGEVAETVPCVPQNVSTGLDCSTNDLTVRWEYSHGADFYIASAVRLDGAVHICQTADTSCVIRGLSCGQSLTVYVVASNFKCNSSESVRVIRETANCPPDQVQATLDCLENHALVSWQTWQSKASCTASMEDEVGGLLSCSTTGSSCNVSGLKCGQKYKVWVTQHSGTCPAAHSKSIDFDSVSCGPEDVSTQLNCGNGTLDVSWATSAHVDGYVAIMLAGSGERTHCNTTETRCTFDGLQCGESYTVVVMSNNGSCLSLPSRGLTIQEVPCVPTEVSVSHSCEGNLANVMWTPTPGAQHYRAIARSNGGAHSECVSSGTACNFNDLQCGRVYTVGVVALSGDCTSLESKNAVLQTAPCTPSNVVVQTNCSGDRAFVSWGAIANAVSYLASAGGVDGHILSCESSEPGCWIEGLHCSREYSFTVSSDDGACQSPSSDPVQQETAPCAPRDTESHIDCSTSVLTVSWDARSELLLNYSVIVLAEDTSTYSCTTWDATCKVEGLQCGRQYRVYMAAGRGNCSSMTTAPEIIHTAPCIPQTVKAAVMCGTNTLVISWDSSSGATAYTATVTSSGGDPSKFCSTSELTCMLDGLRCTQQYTATVVAQGKQCNSTASSAISVVTGRRRPVLDNYMVPEVSLSVTCVPAPCATYTTCTTGPCEPEGMATHLGCDDNAVLVSWNASPGALEYTVLAKGRKGDLSSCYTMETTCLLTRLTCGQMYNITVLAGDGNCNSSSLTYRVVETAPCAPVMINHSLVCETNMATVSWRKEDVAVGYVINATSVMGHRKGCNANGTFCELPELQCGKTYMVQGMSLGKECNSEPSSELTIVTAPCPPAMVKSTYYCNSNIALISWDESLGRESFLVRVMGGRKVYTQNTMETTSTFTGLECQQKYNVTVRAVAKHCNSSQEASTEFHTAPCAPQNVSVILLCANNTAEVTWQASPGAASYNVTALARDGDSKSCFTTQTLCQLPRMHCGQTYIIAVVPNSDTCFGFFSTAITYIAGPCPPNNISVALTCEGNLGFVTWDPVMAAEMYIATATTTDGHVQTCKTNTTSCSFLDLHCGEVYSVTAVTLERGCQSEPSGRNNFRTAICPPSNLRGQVMCVTHGLMVTWDRSPRDDVTYFLNYQTEGRASTTHVTSSISYQHMGLCGERYFFELLAQDDTCNSSWTQSLKMDTAPCPPTSLKVQVDCGTNRGRVSWMQSPGALVYTAVITGSHGHRTSCSSNSTTCDVRLDCGRRYTAMVFSSNEACNSTMDAAVEFVSAPCLPGNIRTKTDCDANEFAVQWEMTPGPNLYTALAIGGNGHRATCETTETFCTIQNLQCGQTYSIVITTASSKCNMIQDSNHKVKSAPCRPTNPTVDLNCSTNMAIMSWEYVQVTQMYQVKAVDSRGESTTCNTTGANCTFFQLDCGERYIFSVVGFTDQCESAVSSTADLLTAPCKPTHVMASLNCESGIVSIVWDPAKGANTYIARAEGTSGHTTFCAGNDTNCTIKDLLCGQDYSIAILAANSHCTTSSGEPTSVTTGPCPHHQLAASLHCASNTATISWTPGKGTLSYSASAEALAITHSTSCTTATSSCDITSLECSQEYRVSVSGQGLTCLSPASSWITFNTASCPPTQVTVQSFCGSDTVSVSWTPVTGVMSYMAAAEGRDGHVASCNSSHTVCDIPGLHCGQIYEVFVAALDEHCIAGKSEMHILKTAPCEPQDVDIHLECQSGVLGLSWEPSRGADRYRVEVVSDNGLVKTCNTESTSCDIPDLQCGLEYTVSAVALDDKCNSSHSLAKSFTSAPCPPDHITASADCFTGNVSIFWSPTVQGVQYVVTVKEPGSRFQVCNVTGLQCVISGLQCGAEYTLEVSGETDGCVGAPSTDHPFQTVPCVPLLVGTKMDCPLDSAWVEWRNPQEAELYVASAEDTQGQVVYCNGGNGVSGCSVPGLRCSLQYTFTVTASNQQCTSAPSNAMQMQSAPCPPEYVNMDVDCENGTMTASWPLSRGALSYTATLRGPDGKTWASCTTNGSDCDIGTMPCGESLALAVVAEGASCYSRRSQDFPISTVPCSPQILEATLRCGDNMATVTWNRSRGAERYLVKATSSDDHQATCISRGATCYLRSLSCGKIYTVTVRAEDSTCSSAWSHPVEIKTGNYGGHIASLPRVKSPVIGIVLAFVSPWLNGCPFPSVPCIPENVDAHFDCESRTMIVSWSASDGADSYTATLEDSDERFTNCQTLGASSCNVTGLHCGQVYHVSVTASDGHCTSQESIMLDVHSVPCLPRHIKASMDCERTTAVVTWDFSPGAMSYVATATATSGHVATCDTTHTNCEMSSLACGERYLVSVLARGETCNSTSKMPRQLMTEPCMPLHVSIQYNPPVGQVYWDTSMGASYYITEAETSDGLQTSCTTTDNYCALYNMACGREYNITVISSNQACEDIVASDPISQTTEPCPPKNVQARVDCRTNIGHVSWEESDGAVGYLAILDGRDGDSAFCYTTTTSCTLDTLHCGTIYYTRVQSIGEAYNSSDSTTYSLLTAPCVPDMWEAQVNCENDTVLASWNYSSGVESYILTARGIDGHSTSCITRETSCALVGLTCGNAYTLRLAVSTHQCSLMSPTEFTLQTKPCPPAHVSVELQCGSRTATVSWRESEGVELYTASAVASAGMYAEDRNTTDTSCLFANLECGETYTFTVRAYSGECQGQASKTIDRNTEPCQPTNVTAQGSCENDTVVLQWAETKGASIYVVSALGDLGYVVDLKTPNTSIPAELPCGQTYNLSVVAWDDYCDSLRSSVLQYRTVPCTPQNVVPSVQCEDSVGSVSWAQSDGAQSYVAVAVGLDGHTHTCASRNPNCTWDELHCGNLYGITAIAEDELCSSLPSSSVYIHTAPCVPQNLRASLNCSTKVTLLTWDPSPAAKFYTVTADSTDGQRVQLSTGKMHAYISELTCSHVYSLTVTAMSTHCTSAASPPMHWQTEACPPTATTPELDCVSNIAAVTWEAVEGAEFYITTAYSEDGQSDTCMSPTTRCSLAGLQCGQMYTVSVTAVNQQCGSDPSVPSMFHSVPCLPQGLSVEMHCMENEVLVTWNNSQGALSYRAVAQHDGGSPIFCESHHPGCMLTGLLCGTLYTLHVIAVGEACSSLPSESVDFHSVPCTPEITSMYLDCVTNSLVMWWDPAEGASSYVALADSRGADSVVCRTNVTGCHFLDLDCGRVYTVRLLASDGQCNSSLSTSEDVESVPCTPENVEAELICYSDAAYVEWEASRGAESYVVQAVGAEGHISFCNTTEVACEVPDLVCGDIYNISVVAVLQDCNVSESSVVELNSMPCAPQLVDAAVDCETGAVMVTWEHSPGATSYTAFAQALTGYNSSCNVTETVCEFDDLLCGLPYAFHVVALDDDACTSLESMVAYVDTVPCEPHNVTVMSDCSSDGGLIRWEEAEHGDFFHVLATGLDGHQTTCGSDPFAECWLTGLHCGQRYNLTITVLDHVCNSSHTYRTLQSAPCEPQDVQGVARCGSGSAWVSWRDSGEVESYQATATAPGSQAVNCNTSDNHCELDGLQCGRTYHISVLSTYDTCRSAEVRGQPFQTAPCPPQHVEVLGSCSPDRELRWDSDSDADYFVVSVKPENGTQHSYKTGEASWRISHLTCGQNYYVYVTAFHGSCRSMPSLTVQVPSVPCTPQQVSGNLECGTNSAWVMWEPSPGALSYRVTAESVDGHSSSCSGSPSSSPCNVPSLQCGMTYTFRVTAIGHSCESQLSSTYKLMTAPCLPKSITAVTECHSDTIAVNWERTQASPLYIAIADGNDGSTLSCNSTVGTCQLAGAHCGTEYNVIVASYSDKCSSLRSSPYTITTAPCTPQDIVVDACSGEGIKASWPHSFVAEFYLMTATGEDGNTLTWNMSESHLTLTGLRCGHAYSLSIIAMAMGCTSLASSPITLSTAPCIPDNLTVQMECASKSAMLSWDASEGSLEYFARVQPEHGDTLFCGGTNTSCNVSGLECGVLYDFSVLASDSTCNSSFGKPISRAAAPCPPNMVQKRLLPMKDGVQIVRVYWDPVDCPGVTYLVDLMGMIQGSEQALINIFSYWTDYTFFEIPVPCSSTYSVTVTSKNLASTGDPSTAITGSTAPCPPSAITFVGGDDSAVLSWNPSVFATSYTVYRLSNSTRSQVCSTAQLSCRLHSVSHDTVEVTASNSAGQSNPSRDIQDISPLRSKRTLHEAMVDERDEMPIPIVQVAVAGTSLHIRWSTVGGATIYTLTVRPDSSRQPVRPMLIPVYGGSHTVTDLEPNTRYCVSLSATVASASGPFSEPSCVRTGTTI